MTVTLISYATPNFYKSQKRLVQSALKVGVQNVICFNNLWLNLFQRPFINKNKKHFKFKRGAGYWVWKPFIILKALERIKDDDYLIYLDAGIEIVEPLDALLKICDKNDGFMLFSTFYFPNRNWTKRDVFIAMACDYRDCWDAKQLEAGMMVLKKTPKTLHFVSEWLSWCEDLNLVSDSPNQCGLPNLNEFIAPRWDQSILSLLAFKYQIKLYRSPHQFTNNLKTKEFRSTGEYLDNNPLIPEDTRGRYAPDVKIIWNSPYGTIFNHHRQRNRRLAFQLPHNLISFWRDAYRTEKWLKNPSSSA